MSDLGWGGAAWGTSPWGGFDDGDFLVVTDGGAKPVRENVIRLEFTTALYFSGLFDAYDASDPRHYTIQVVDGTRGLDDTPVRPVAVTLVELVTDGSVARGRAVDLILDRPMTPWPSRYRVVYSNLAQAFDPTVRLSGTVEIAATYRRIEPPQIDTAQPSRDFANPQTRRAMLDPLPDPNDAEQLGCFPIDETGDYATDEGDTSFRKRILRRCITRKNGFLHLPGYGLGILDEIKRLSSPGKRGQLEEEAQNQIGQEPDAEKVLVRIVTSPTHPNLARMLILARKRGGADVKVVLPVLIP